MFNFIFRLLDLRNLNWKIGIHKELELENDQSKR